MEKQKIQAQLISNSVTSNSEEAFALNEKSSFGAKVKDKVEYSLVEAMYLIEKNKLELMLKSRKLTKKEALAKFSKIDKKFPLKYSVLSDLRERGYIVKTALKFGADFRVYDKGHKPGSEHAKWLVFTEHENSKLAWQEFSAKNRVAHSTNKALLIAIVDDEGDVSYYEVRWIRP